MVEDDALTRIDRTAARTEARFLVAVDSNRDRIFTAARRAYSRGGRAFLT
jgi:hypothetical protein